MRQQLAAALTGLLMLCTGASAGSLQVSPVLVDVAPPGAAASVQLGNLSDQAMVAQVRIFKWSQVNGVDKLEETKDVVVSPPIAKIKPNGQSVIRVVRRAKSAPQGEESYRIVVDQVPEKKTKGSGISFAVRYSIPAFFGSLDDGTALIVWNVASAGSKTVVTATNTGSRRVRIADLKLRSNSGTLSFGEGLAGWILPSSTVRWTTGGKLKGLTQDGKVSISASTEHGPLQATGIIQAAQ